MREDRVYTEEKPVLNEKFESESINKFQKWDFPERTTVEKSKPRTKEVHDENKMESGIRLFSKEHWEDALELFLLVESAGFNDEDRAELAYYLGLCCTKLERFDEASLYLEQVITLDSALGGPIRTYQCRMILSYIYIMTGHADMAESELNRLQAGGLESVMLYNTMAYAAFAQKRYLAAIDFYEKSLDIDKDNTTALNSLGYILADTGLDKLKGLRLCRKAVEKNPKNAAYLDSLGWASYKCGKTGDARKWLRQAMDIAPQEKVISDHFRIVSREAM